MSSYLIAGAGYVGTALAKTLIEQGHTVSALRRSEDGLRALKSIGAVPVRADLADPSSLRHLPPAERIVVCVAPSEGSAESYRDTYLTGVRNLLHALSKDSPKEKRLIYLSSTGVYGEAQGRFVDESSPPVPSSETGKILLDAEAQVLGGPIPAIVFRLGGIYGPDRNRIKSVLAGRIPGEHLNTVVNLIHRDDIVRGILHLFEHGKAGEVYLGVDDEPVTRREYCGWIAKRLGVKAPVATREEKYEENALLGKKCRNAKLKTLGFRFNYPTFREGYEKELGDRPSYK